MMCKYFENSCVRNFKNIDYEILNSLIFKFLNAGKKNRINLKKIKSLTFLEENHIVETYDIH